MLTLVICCLSDIYHIGRELLFIVRPRSFPIPSRIMAKVSAFFYSICSACVSLINEQAMDSKILGERLRQIRLMLGLTQKELAAATYLAQPVISRLENGEEVYASVLLSVLYYYHGKISLDRLFAPDFIAAKEKLMYNGRADMLQKMVRQLDLISDAIRDANETSLAQIDRLKKEML